MCKCICIIYTAILYQRKHDAPLFTVGDAVVSFLSKPDPTSQKMCLVSKSMIYPSSGLRSFKRSAAVKFTTRKTTTSADCHDIWRQPYPLEWNRRQPRWFEGASRRRWRCTISSSVDIPLSSLANAEIIHRCLFVVFAGGGLLALALATLQNTSGSTGYFVQAGFGAVSQYTQGRLGVPESMPFTSQLYCDILFANVWQCLVSILYVQYNSLLTCMLVNREWYHYSAERKSLRVSNQVGLQRSSYFVSIPLRYGMPLIVTVAVLHWTLSQSIFVLLVEVFDDESRLANWASTTVGFSVWPIITCKFPLLCLRTNTKLTVITNSSNHYRPRFDRCYCSLRLSEIL
jgi:hypothetical protein